MSQFPVFLSVVVVVRNRAHELAQVLTSTAQAVAPIVEDHEIVIVDNASEDDSVAVLKKLTGEGGLPNLQVYALTKEVDTDTASWVGLENALGDFVAVVDPFSEDITFLPTMLDKAVSGADVVLAVNEHRPKQSLSYRLSVSAFDALYRAFTGVRLSQDAPTYRVISRRVVNFILQHPQPPVTYRHLPATGGFARATLRYSFACRAAKVRSLSEGVDRGVRLLVSTTRGPMRLVTSLSLFGALANLLYSVYVIVIFIIKKDVAPGWVTLSLQQSGMFFLISLVLLALGEYILHMATLSNEGPRYHVAQEYTSALMTRRQKLNVLETEDARLGSTRQTR